ncbi:jade2 [Pungitius sinensis]
MRVFQVRNLCYMVTRREKMKHTMCDLQEKIFHLQIKLLEEDLAGEKSQKGERSQQSRVKEKGKERRKSSPEKKDRLKSENGSLLRELGLSTSFPLDESLFDSWLAQTVQITADDMLSQWALGGQHRDKSGSLLSDQLLQGEESLLNLRLENSLQSTWKTPQLGRKPRGGSKSRGPRGPPQPAAPLPSTASSPPAAKQTESAAEDTPAHVGRRGERPRGPPKALHHHYLHRHRTRSSDPHRAPPPPPPTSKMDSCHISEERGPWDSVSAGGGPARQAAVPRLRLSRLGRSRGGGASGAATGLRGGPESAGKDSTPPDAAENEGYFSDGEQSDPDTRSRPRKLRLPQLHSGKEELLRRSVLAS